MASSEEVALEGAVVVWEGDLRGRRGRPGRQHQIEAWTSMKAAWRGTVVVQEYGVGIQE